MILEEKKKFDEIINSGITLLNSKFYKILVLADDEFNILEKDFLHFENLISELSDLSPESSLLNQARIDVLKLRLKEIEEVNREITDFQQFLETEFNGSLSLLRFSEKEDKFRRIKTEYKSIMDKNTFESEWNYLEMKDLQMELIKEDLKKQIRFITPEVRNNFISLERRFTELNDLFLRREELINLLRTNVTGKEVSNNSIRKSLKLSSDNLSQLLMLMDSEGLGRYSILTNRFMLNE
jgi:hypothetical protein